MALACKSQERENLVDFKTKSATKANFDTHLHSIWREKKFKVNTRLNLHAYRVSSRLKAFAKKLLRSIENESYVSRYQIKTATSWKVFSFWSHPKKNLEFYDPNNFTTLSIHWRIYCLADVVWCIKNVCPLTFQSCVKCWQTLISLIYL